MSEWKNGLPPVGEVCEGKYITDITLGFEWRKCLVLYRFEEEAAVQDVRLGRLYYCDEFRPLKSEAERKRDEAVEEIKRLLTKFDHIPGGPKTDLARADWLYKHGYRKVNPLTDEQIDRVKYSTRYDFGECSYETAAYRSGMRDARRIIMGENS